MFVRTIGVRGQIEMGEFVCVEHESIVVVEAGGPPPSSAGAGAGTFASGC